MSGGNRSNPNGRRTISNPRNRIFPGQRPSSSRAARSVGQDFSRYETGPNEMQGNPPSLPNRNQQNRRRPFKLGFKKIEEWSNKGENELLLEVIGKKAALEEYLEEGLEGDIVVLVTKILAKLSLSAFTENKAVVMNIAANENFIENLIIFIIKLPLQTVEDRKWNRFFWNDIDGFFNNLITMLNAIIDIIPTRACEVLPKLLKALSSYLPNFEREHNVELSNEIKVQVTRLTEKLELNKVELEKKKVVKASKDYVEEQPPDDFRDLSVYPLSEEIINPKRAFVRRNVIEGKYENVEHYLDVQFRLLKEDFVAPLREGVCSYLDQSKTKTNSSNIRLHTNVIFLSPQYNRDQVGVLVQFPLKNKNTNFTHSKRFMFGSLVCFTNDNFKTFLFGRIIDRDIKFLNKGQVMVGFDPEYNNYILNTKYIMIECSVFFEPYYHVLKALQNMPEYDFPMKNYLIDVNCAVEFPGYLDEDSTFRIRQPGEETTGDRTILSDSETWPTAIMLGLDDTQYSAYKAALTNKFAVIQGPPGTGKTYLGLRIVKTLIENKLHWYNGTPILIICFTNHALDQFLEGLIEVTDKIIRVGGQSKNEKLQLYNLKNKRQGRKDFAASHALFVYRKSLGQVMQDIKVLTENKKGIDQFNVIYNFHNFSTVDTNIKNSWFNKATSADMLNWLLSGSTQQGRRNEFLRTEVMKLEDNEANEGNSNNAAKDENSNNEEGIDGDYYLNQLQNNALTLDIDDIFENNLSNTQVAELKSITSLNELSHEIAKISNILNIRNQTPENERDHNFFNEQWELENRVWELANNLHYLRMRLGDGIKINASQPPRDVDYNNPHNMYPNDRWQLYFHWLHLYKEHATTKLLVLQQQHHTIYKSYIEIRNIEDTELMKGQLIVGMTTTGAARLQNTLQALKCQIVVVEEAAEVLESHITVSLTNHCNHLILIGDHQQLRPSAATYRLEKDFNLGISMFERMVLNKIQCHRLGVQHRMRPEIAKLISPSIYPKLENHHSVYNFPPVLGVDSWLYFIDHQHPEIEAGDSSKANIPEAKFLIRLARYLIQNGYQPEDITILAAYSGQMFALWKERNASYDFLLKDVKITILDNYQGEECKIILLSLVRSNDDKKIGFLRIENRVCVALSRAKEGLYIMGNMDLLSENSEIWPKIKFTLEEQNAIGKFLTLRCQIHPEESVNASDAKDFDKTPEGGCNKICGALLSCQHRCTKICHILDRVHANAKCTAPCERKPCDRQHPCPKMCYEDCGNCMVLVQQTLGCGHEVQLQCHKDVTQVKCSTPVPTTLPCDHHVENKPCFIKAESFTCPFPCTSRIEPCGHSCRRSCHVRNDPDHLEYKCFKACAKFNEGCSTETHQCPKTCHEVCPPCDIIVQKTRTNCAHRMDVPCNTNVDAIPCSKPCKKKLDCGHFCKKKCFEECGGCREIVSKIVDICGHRVKIKCSDTPNKKDCNGACPLELNCGHPCQSKCKEPCTERCLVLVDHTKLTACGHKFKIPCYLLERGLAHNSYKLLKHCTEPCSSILKCTHACSGTCGSCYQGRIHQTCKQKCGVPLICGHECPITCREACRPCEKPCMVKCKHSKCKKKCGEPCTKCTERCRRHCKHLRCKALCGALCTVPPCDEPCDKKLRCGHLCVGFCGDPCPRLCRICDEEELTEILFGDEDEIDARFVMLDECKHVIESKGMDKFCQFQSDDPESSKEINYKKCPKCNTMLTSTQRYSDYIKQVNQDVVMIKNKSFGKPREIEQKRTMLLQNTKKLLLHPSGIISSRNAVRCSTKIPTLLKELEAYLQKCVRQKQLPFNLIIATTLEAKLQILDNILNIFKSCTPSLTSSWLNVVDYVDMLIDCLLKELCRITNQEISDFDTELLRFQRMEQFIRILNAPNYHGHKLEDKVITLHSSIETLLFKPVKYENDIDDQLKLQLTQFNKLVESDVGITEAERRQIVNALGLKQGHWYKCPNGHYYVIGDCGGANQVSRCNECRAQIGGSRHTLLPGNAHAGEMDGSRFAAWSETANNMFNFGFRQ